MTWTYGGNPAASTIDAIRLEIGDTIEEEQLLQDEELEYFYEEEGSILGAAARACEAIAAKFSREADLKVGDLSLSASQKADLKVGDLSLSASQKAEHYREKAKVLRERSQKKGSTLGKLTASTIKTDKYFLRDMFKYDGEATG